jgi:hypothetical protein
MTGKKRKRLYSLVYTATGEPVYIEDAGHLLKISGVLLQGMDTDILLLSPTANHVPGAEYIEIVQPTLPEWCEVLRRTDDPLVFEQEADGTIKAVHRKQQYAISGAIQQKVWVRDEFLCLFCGLRMGDVQLTVDHFMPLELGGANEMANYASCCRQCNKAKGSMHPERFCSTHQLDYSGLVQYLAGDQSMHMVGHLWKVLAEVFAS